jgi:hypothetical protein
MHELIEMELMSEIIITLTEAQIPFVLKSVNRALWYCEYLMSIQPGSRNQIEEGLKDSKMSSNKLN